MSEKKCEAREIIFREGDGSEYAYVVKSGKVEILKTAAHGEISLAKLGEGDVFGEMGLFDKLPRSATARAIDDNTILEVIDEGGLDAMLKQCPEPLARIVTAVFNRLRQVNERVSQSEQATVLLDSDISAIRIAPADEEAFAAKVKPAEAPVAQLPFRIGGYENGGKPGRYDHNDMFLPCDGPPLAISRHHCEVAIEDNAIYLIDKGSRFGTVVNGVQIGRGRGHYKFPLKEGANEVRLGGPASPYVLTVTCVT